MSMPFYVAPEQFMRDKADFARKNIARGRPLVAVVYGEGILLCAENPSRSLHKVSEIYDQIAFAGVGRYNEFDQLRRSGVQHADVKGYQFSREDVDARSLANLYAQYMGNVFTHDPKPLEVEILVAEVGSVPGTDQLFHILYDGSIVDEDRLTVLGGEAEAITGRLEGSIEEGWELGAALRAAVAALAGPERSLAADELEVAVLARSNGRRAFKRLTPEAVGDLLATATDVPAHDGDDAAVRGESDPTAESVAAQPDTELLDPRDRQSDGAEAESSPETVTTVPAPRTARKRAGS